MLRLFVYSATVALLSVTAQPAATEQVHESPHVSPLDQPRAAALELVEVEAGRLYDAHDLEGSRLAAGDRIAVTSFPSSGRIDPSSRSDH